jgi:glutamyl-tRNA synthetase
MSQNIRVRFAPSPTGQPHIGGIWTAFFNYIFARQNNGQFILRIEDTDQKRLVKDSVDGIYDALNWFDIKPDEDPRQGGKFGPYVQSERLEIYQEHAHQLVKQGSAYHCFCSAERLDQLRANQTAAKLAPRYDRHCANLSVEEVEKRIAAGESSVIRMKLPTRGEITHHDIIRGDVVFRFDQLDDSVIFKSDGFPTYHLANVVDDHLMEISHVIRAEEWLPSVPKHLFLYQAFGWTPPAFSHLPQLMGPDRSKLSKRHGDTSALTFRDAGYLPAALRNFMVLMGWHPKGDQEVLTDTEIIQQFKLEDVNPSGAIFDYTKLDWLNGVYIRQLDDQDLITQLKPFWQLPKSLSTDYDWQLSALRLVKDRLHKLSEINNISGFLIPKVWDESLAIIDPLIFVPKKGSANQVLKALAWAKEIAEQERGQWTAATLKSTFIAKIAEAGRKNLDVLWPLRVAMSLSIASPDVFDIMSVLGPDESIRRIEKSLKILSS